MDDASRKWFSRCLVIILCGFLIYSADRGTLPIETATSFLIAVVVFYPSIEAGGFLKSKRRVLEPAQRPLPKWKSRDDSRIRPSVS